jgi:hypothetical protein
MPANGAMAAITARICLPWLNIVFSSFWLDVFF